MVTHAISNGPTGRREERLGLIVAIVLHVGLLAFLLVQPRTVPAAPTEERMTVSLAEDVGMESAAPVIVRESRAPQAPDLSELPTPPTMREPPAPAIARPIEPAPPRPAQARTQPQPAPPRPAARRAEASRPTPAQPAERRPSAPRVGSDFLAGAGASETTSETRAPAAQIGARELASLRQAITRQIKPKWTAPQGVDAEKLVTVLSWKLNRDGSLAGKPRIVRQSGVTDANTAQKAVHAERAIRAVELAAPFDLPNELYSEWAYIEAWEFDRRL